MEVPSFEKQFPRHRAFSKLRRALADASQGRLASQQLLDTFTIGSNDGSSDSLGAILAQPQALRLTGADMSLRQKLASNPKLKLNGQPVPLTQQMAKEVFAIADDLRISEVEALTLYAESSKPSTRRWLESSCPKSFVDTALQTDPSPAPLVLGNDVCKTVKELYFFERLCLVQGILYMLQHRIDPDVSSDILAATDSVVTAGLATKLVELVRESTRMIVAFEEELKGPKSSSFAQAAPTTSMPPKFGRVLVQYIQQERQIASQCLFFLAYHTQLTPQEVCQLIDLVRDLSNGTSSKDGGLTVSDPFNDVPDAYHRSSDSGQSWQGPFTTAPQLNEKNTLEWQDELVKQQWRSGGKPQLLECIGVLVGTVVAALDTKSVLHDRSQHGPNSFGEVRTGVGLATTTNPLLKSICPFSFSIVNSFLHFLGLVWFDLIVPLHTHAHIGMSRATHSFRLETAAPRPT